MGQKQPPQNVTIEGSFASDAQLLAHAVRSHWGIENNWHWVLDVGFKEDDCSIHSGHAPENLGQLRKMSLNLLAQEKTAKIGVANKRLKAASVDHKVSFRERILLIAIANCSKNSPKNSNKHNINLYTRRLPFKTKCKTKLTDLFSQLALTSQETLENTINCDRHSYFSGHKRSQ